MTLQTHLGIAFRISNAPMSGVRASALVRRSSTRHRQGRRELRQCLSRGRESSDRMPALGPTAECAPLGARTWRRNAISPPCRFAPKGARGKASPSQSRAALPQPASLRRGSARTS